MPIMLTSIEFEPKAIFYTEVPLYTCMLFQFCKYIPDINTLHTFSVKSSVSPMECSACNNVSVYVLYYFVRGGAVVPTNIHMHNPSAGRAMSPTRSCLVSLPLFVVTLVTTISPDPCRNTTVATAPRGMTMLTPSGRWRQTRGHMYDVPL